MLLYPAVNVKGIDLLDHMTCKTSSDLQSCNLCFDIVLYLISTCT